MYSLLLVILATEEFQKVSNDKTQRFPLQHQLPQPQLQQDGGSSKVIEGGGVEEEIAINDDEEKREEQEILLLKNKQNVTTSQINKINPSNSILINLVHQHYRTPHHPTQTAT